MAPYQRNAIDVFPVFKKGLVPIARFFCGQENSTFSLLPIQLIPYYQYTVSAVIMTLLFALRYRQVGRQGYYGASVEVDPDSAVTPWLVACWLVMVAKGFERAHATLCSHYDLSGIRSTRGTMPPWTEVSVYLRILIGTRQSGWPDRILAVSAFYSDQTKQFLFGVASQHRRQQCV